MVSIKPDFTRKGYGEKLRERFLHFLSRTNESLFPAFSRGVSLLLVGSGEKRDVVFQCQNWSLIYNLKES